MQLIDLHADTLTALYYRSGEKLKDQEFLRELPVANLAQNNCAIDLAKLRQADSLAQFFVLWLNLHACELHKLSPWDLFMKQYQQLRQQIDTFSSQISLVSNVAELLAARAQNKLAGFVCVEEGAFISSLEQLDVAYRLGVRYITLVWNYETHIAVPSAIDQQRGLKPFGFEMVAAMQELGMLVDVSHLSDQGVRDVLQIAKKPIIASHSNVRALCNHTRNLSDELIRGIAQNGGIIGVNCVPYFLDEQDKTIRIQRMVEHIQYIYRLAGEDVLAIGNDFDGFCGLTPELDEIKTIADLPLVADALIKAGFSARQVDKIFNKNVLRILATIN
jgi:membrane dipeptidase